MVLVPEVAMSTTTAMVAATRAGPDEYHALAVAESATECATSSAPNQGRIVTGMTCAGARKGAAGSPHEQPAQPGRREIMRIPPP